VLAGITVEPFRITHRAREASISCRFIRRKDMNAADKWQTIGIGGQRVSDHNLAIECRHPSESSLQSSENDKAARITPKKKRRTEHVKGGSRSIRSMVHWVVKAVDDFLLGLSGPVVAQILALCHNLPKATYAVEFEKVSLTMKT
jgi:hypothetical protein